MPRPMTSEMLAACQAGTLYPAIFIEAHFATGPAYVWTGIGTINWDGHTWSGVGSLLDITTPEDGSTVQARGITLTLSGIDVSFLAAALQEFRVGLPVLLYFALFDAAGVLIPDPLSVWAGRMDQPTVDAGSETATISINCENRLLDMNVAVDRRYTQDDQQIDHPGDMGFQFVPGVAEINIYWGRSPTTANNA